MTQKPIVEVVGKFRTVMLYGEHNRCAQMFEITCERVNSRYSIYGYRALPHYNKHGHLADSHNNEDANDAWENAEDVMTAFNPWIVETFCVDAVRVAWEHSENENRSDFGEAKWKAYGVTACALRKSKTYASAVHATDAAGLPACGAALPATVEVERRFDPWNKMWRGAEIFRATWIPSCQEVSCKKCLKLKKTEG